MAPNSDQQQTGDTDMTDPKCAYCAEPATPGHRAAAHTIDAPPAPTDDQLAAGLWAYDRWPENQARPTILIGPSPPTTWTTTTPSASPCTWSPPPPAPPHGPTGSPRSTWSGARRSAPPTPKSA